MNKLKKTTTSLLTIIALTAQPYALNAKSFWDTDGTVYTNFTRGASATEPTTGTKYFSGGSLELRFKKSSSYVPIFNLEAPGVKADCSGISFNAGFAAFINLDQLGNQLKDAGASIAWGVMISLAYSLPALKQVFDEINKWATFLNELLSKSCEFGKTLGSKLKPYTDEVLGPINSAVENASGFLSTNSPENLMKKLANDGKITEQDTKNLANVVFINQILQQAKDGIVSSYITSLAREKIESGFTYPSVSARDVGIELKYLDELNLSQTSQIGVFVLLNILQKDIALSNDALSILSDVANPSVSKNDLTKRLTNKITQVSGAEKVSFTNVNTFKTMGESELMNFFINGEIASSSIEDLRVPEFANVTYKLPNGKDIKFTLLIESYGIATKNFKEYFKDYEGLAPTSAKTIAHIANTYIKGFEGKTVDPLANSVPMMNPMFYDAIKTYIIAHGKKRFANSKAEVEGSKITFSRDKRFEGLLNKLVAYNSYLVLEDIIVAIESYIYKYNENLMNVIKKVDQNDSSPKLESAPKSDSTDSSEKVTFMNTLRSNLSEFKKLLQTTSKKEFNADWLETIIKGNKEVSKKNAIENSIN